VGATPASSTPTDADAHVEAVESKAEGSGAPAIAPVSPEGDDVAKAAAPKKKDDAPKPAPAPKVVKEPELPPAPRVEPPAGVPSNAKPKGHGWFHRLNAWVGDPFA
jgi:hypothetical protein